MVNISSTDIQNLVVLEVGDTNPPILAPIIGTIWATYAAKAAIYPGLQEAYTKRRCIDIVLGAIRNQVAFNTSGSLSLSLNQRTGYLKDRRDETIAEIERLETAAKAGRPPVIAPLATVNIQSPPVGSTLDANDEVYRGSPYVTTRNQNI